MKETPVLNTEMHPEAKVSLVLSVFVVTLSFFLFILVIGFVAPFAYPHLHHGDYVKIINVSLICSSFAAVAMSIVCFVRGKRLLRGSVRIEEDRNVLVYGEKGREKEIDLASIIDVRVGKWNFLMSPRKKLRRDYRFIMIQYSLNSYLKPSLWIRCPHESEVEKYLQDLNLKVPILRFLD